MVKNIETNVIAMNEIAKNNKDRNSLYRKQQFYYLIIKIPFAFMQGIFGIVYVSFFWDILGMDQLLFVIGMIVYGIFNALNDPLLGQWSDRVDVNKWGSRRLIFIKYGGPIWAALFFLMWIPWSYDNQIIIFLHFIVMVVLFDNMLTLVVLVWDALLPEIAETFEDRNKIFFLAGIVGAVGGIPLLFSLSILNSGLGSFLLFTGVLGVANAIIFVIAASNLKERPELHQKIVDYNIVQSLGHCLRKKSFVSFTLYRFCRVVNDTLTSAFLFVYILLFYEGFDTILLIIVGLSGLIGQWLYLKLSKNRSMQSLIMSGKALEISVGIAAFLISLMQGTEFIWLPLAVVKFVLGGNVVFMNPYLLLVCDEDELKFDTRREGMILGTNAIFNKIAETIGPIIGTSVLLLFGFLQNAPEGFVQPESAMIGIKVLLFIVPSIMDALAMLSLKFYPIKGEHLKDLKEHIEIIHREKLITYEQAKILQKE
jgi:GPH family glycoside/pentoside/hexuronide:cation symporter